LLDIRDSLMRFRGCYDDSTVLHSWEPVLWILIRSDPDVLDQIRILALINDHIATFFGVC
jgi:hypothetical protein